MTPISKAIAVFVGFALMATGCTVHHTVAWPPQPGDLARINAASAPGEPMAIKYTEPTPASQPRPAPCAAGSCREIRIIPPPVGYPTDTLRIDGGDDQRLTLHLESGETTSIAASEVGHIIVRDRLLGVTGGAAIGAGIGLLVVGPLIGALGYYGSFGDGCDDCGALVLTAALSQVLLFATIGYFVGGRRVFSFR